MPWQDFVDVEFIKLNGKHMSGALVALVGFSLLTWLSGKILEAGYVLAIIKLADKIVVTCCIIYLAIVVLWELARKLIELFKGPGNGSSPSIFVA